MAAVLSAPVVVGRIPDDLAGPILTGVPRAGPWEVAGRKSRVGGAQTAPALTVSFEGGAEVRVESDVGTASRFVVYPGLSRREYTGALGSTTEHVVCFPDLPIVVVQWVGVGPARVSVEWAGAQADCSAGGAAFEIDGAVVGAVHTDAPTDVRSVGAGGAEIVFDPNSETRSLVLCAGPEASLQRSAQAAKHAAAHAGRAARGPAEDGLVIRTGVTEVDNGWSWLLSRVAGATGSGHDPDDRLTLAMACLAAGLNDAPATRLGGFEDAPVHAAYLAARLAMTTGKDHHAQVAAERLLEGTAPPPGPLTADTYAALAEALRFGASEEEQERLRTKSREARAIAPTVGGVRRLPTIGGPQSVGPSWWQSLIDHTSPTDDGVAGTTRALAGSFLRDPDGAWETWAAIVARGLDGDGAGPGAWSADRVAEAELVLALVHGLLGYASDAPSGRYVLAPKIPSDWTHVSVNRIPTGGGAFGLTYQNWAMRHRFHLTPERGSVPVILVFEPSVTGAVVEVRVDSAPSPLASEFVDGRSMTQLQLPLDGDRAVELDAAEAP